MSEASSREMRKIGEGREAEMFAWDEGKVLRLLRTAGAQGRLQWEAAAMEAARSRGISVPAVYELTTVMGRPGMVMERLEGPDLLTLAGRQPWKVFWVARVIGEIHAQLHSARAPERIPALRSTLRQRIESCGDRLGELGEFALGVLEGLPDGDSLCHGDFHPGNVMMREGAPVVIDWTCVGRGDGAADVARTLVMVRMGEPPQGSPVVLRLLRAVGRGILISTYLRVYRRRRPLEMELVARWEIPVAAARLADGIEEETGKLLAYLERARSRAG